jgi:hypothetical protein
VVPSKKILGYVQVEPRGIPISKEKLRDLIVLQAGSIGGPINCEIDLAGAGQKMRLNRFDANNSFRRERVRHRLCHRGPRQCPAAQGRLVDDGQARAK